MDISVDGLKSPKGKQEWQSGGHPARLYTPLDDGSVQCHLSPRNCVIKPGKTGYCRVRGNLDGRLVTLNYGKSVAMTEESIETEAVYHYAPGARILSMGNIGCMMHCDYCHNWRTSQARYVTDDQVHRYTPESVVEEALDRGIRVLSWTYNDPVVWHEFVLDTARLAREHGLINLYKSAFFISLAAASELLDVIDIFSISIKSMDPGFYRRVTKGWLEPVLEATEYVYRRGKHVEVSNLVVTDANDTVDQTARIADWVLTSLDSSVPLHYVRFHPDYKYTSVGRTPIDRLEAAREDALARGIEYCYLGNVYDSDATNSYCPRCGAMVVQRYGLLAQPVGLMSDGSCSNCRAPLPFKLIEAPAAQEDEVERPTRDWPVHHHRWRGDVRAVHVEVHNATGNVASAQVSVLGGARDGSLLRNVPIMSGRSFRFICCKSHQDDEGITVAHPPGLAVNYYDVYDRAHFPTMAVGRAEPIGDATPGPVFRSASGKAAGPG
jgi:pyruvate formate lyase activating enzyme